MSRIGNAIATKAPPPTVEQCQANQALWADRIRGCADRISKWERKRQRAEALAMDAAKHEELWRMRHRQALALAANGGRE